MTVNPGFGGQSFIDQCVEKIAGLNAIKMERQLNFDIEVDGRRKYRYSESLC